MTARIKVGINGDLNKKAPPPGFEPGIPEGTGYQDSLKSKFQDQRNFPLYFYSTGLCDSGNTKTRKNAFYKVYRILITSKFLGATVSIRYALCKLLAKSRHLELSP